MCDWYKANPTRYRPEWKGGGISYGSFSFDVFTKMHLMIFKQAIRQIKNEKDPTLPRPVQEWCITDTSLIQSDINQNETGGISYGSFSFDVLYGNVPNDFQK